MKLVLKSLIVLTSLPLLGLGLAALCTPNAMLGLFDLIPKGVYGYNTIRADLGGLLIGSGLMILIGLWKRNKNWFDVAIMMMGLLLFGRVVSTIADGWSNMAIPAIVVEVFAVTVLTIAKKSWKVIEA